MQNSTARQVLQVTYKTIAGNCVLSAFKLVAGIVSNSSAMVADALHSVSDVASSVVVAVGAAISGKEPDADHPYGHERLEGTVSIIMANILLLTGVGIAYSAVASMIAANREVVGVPGALALVAAIVSIAAKETMYHYTMRAAKKFDSISLKADAWHHRSDAISSVGSFIGILGARLGMPVLDAVAGLAIGLLIVKVAVDIFRETMDKLVDKACDQQTESAITELVLAQPGVLTLDMLKTRQFGAKMYVDIEIGANGNLNLVAAHDIAATVHIAVETGFPKTKHCMVHVNPKTPLNTLPCLK